MSEAEAAILDQLDFAVPCGADPGCADPVMWLWTCARCGFSAPCCTFHQQVFDRLIDSAKVAEVTCNGCRENVITNYEWRARP